MKCLANFSKSKTPPGNSFEAVKPDRDGLFNAYRNTLSEDEFVEYMEQITRWCEVASADIPMKPEKVDCWHRIEQETRGADTILIDYHIDKRTQTSSRNEIA